MPCWGELWQNIRDEAPMIGVLLGLVAWLLVAVVLLWAPRIHNRKFRWASRFGGAVVLLPLVIVLPALLLGFALASGNPPAQSRVISSPRGMQAAVTYNAGFLGRDFTKVTLKGGRCQNATVFWHAGPSDFVDPQVQWVDDQHLTIRFHTRTGDRIFCAALSGAVHVDCEGEPWPR